MLPFLTRNKSDFKVESRTALHPRTHARPPIFARESPKTGPVILSGDVVHFQTSFEHRYVPNNNWSKEASLQSVDKIAAVIAKEHSQLWINHDQPQSDA